MLIRLSQAGCCRSTDILHVDPAFIKSALNQKPKFTGVNFGQRK
jgi:hypothetical protein